jgi:hypothetical protein
MKKPKTKSAKKAKAKKVFDEFKAGTLHSGSKQGPKVTSRKQAIAIALSQSGQSKYGKKKRPRSKKKSMSKVEKALS